VRPARRASHLALAVVAAVAAAGCCRLFGDAGWLVPVAAAVAGACGVGALTARRRPAVAVAAHAGGLAVLLAESAGGHTAYGLPTPATVTALWRAAGRAPEALRAAIVPAPTRPELILAVVGGLWFAVAVADALARRWRAGLAALLPLCAVPVVAAALGTGRLRLPLTFGFAAAAAFYAAVERAGALPPVEARPLRPAPGRRRVLLSRASVFAPRRRTRPAEGPAGAGGPGPRSAGRRWAGRVGPAVAVGVAAVVLGPLVPGVGRAVVDVHTFGVTLDVTRAELNPLVDIRPQLLAPRRTELFTVRAPAPAYWRLTALDRFDGRRWTPSRPALFHHHGAPAAAASAGRRFLHQEVRVTGLDSPWLPAAGRPVQVRASGARLDPETDSLVTKKGSRAVRSYVVESRLPGERARPEAGPAAASPGLFAAPVTPAARRPDLARYLALPARFPREVKELAEQFTAGAATPYDRAVALEDSLRVKFIYDETAPPGASIDALEDFLFGSHRGYCEQFAGAYAAMARSLGLPARVAVGFTPGTWDAGAGLWRVTSRESHAWPEVFLDGLGWTAFEPTPGRVLPDPERRLQTDVALPRSPVANAAGGTREARSVARVAAGAGSGLDAGPGGRPGGARFPAGAARSAAWVAGGLLGLVLIPPAAKRRRRRARRRAGAGDAVLAAWRESLDRLGEVGLVRDRGETPLEFAGRAGAARPGAAGALHQLAVLVNGAAYGPPGAGGAQQAWAASDRVARALDAHDPAWRRWRRRLDPRPLLWGSTVSPRLPVRSLRAGARPVPASSRSRPSPAADRSRSRTPPAPR